MAQNYNENLELLVVSSIVKNAVVVFPIIGDILETESFGWKPFQILYKNIKRVVENDLIPDYVTILVELERTGDLEKIMIQSNGKRGKEALEYMLTVDVDIEKIESYALQVQDMYGSRKLIALNDKIKKALEEGKRPIDVLGMIDIETGKISAFVGFKSNSLRVSNDVASVALDKYKKALGGEVSYILTGIDAWDDFTNGLSPQRLYMIAAASNDGKSALADNIMYNISVAPKRKEDRKKVLIVTLEMSAEERFNRLIQIETGISPLRIERADLTQEETQLYATAWKNISDGNIVYDDSSELSLPLLRTKLRKFKADGGQLAIIDQLEQLQIGGGADTQPDYIRFNYMTYRLKAFARELDLPIIIIHQMNRSADGGLNRGKNVDPQIQDLAQAGEKACDAIVIIRHVREAQEIKESSFYWVKHRQGRRGRMEVEFKGTHVKFKNKEGSSQFAPFALEGR